MKCDDIRPELNAYLDGELDSFIKEAVEKHLHDCVNCRHELDHHRKTISLVKSIPSAMVKPQLDSRVIARLHRTPRSLPMARRFFPSAVVRQFSTALLVFLAVMGVYHLSVYKNADVDRPSLSSPSPARVPEQSGESPEDASLKADSDRAPSLDYPEVRDEGGVRERDKEDVRADIPAPRGSQLTVTTQARESRTDRLKTIAPVDDDSSQLELQIQDKKKTTTGLMESMEAEPPASIPLPAGKSVKKDTILQTQALIDAQGWVQSFSPPVSADAELQELLKQSLQDEGITPIAKIRENEYLLISFVYDELNHRITLIRTQIVASNPE